MDLNNIKCFISLAECLNFTKAAEKEHMTQTSMSRKIVSLENELNIRLFYRDNRQVELTEAGKEFYYQSLKLIELYDRSVNTAQNIHNGFTKELKIGVGIYEHKLISSFLRQYVSGNPALKISCMQYPYHALLKRFEQNLLDIIISSNQFFTELPREGLEMFKVHDVDWKLGINKHNPLAACDVISPESLESQVLITMYEGSASQIIDHYHPYFRFRDVIYVNSFETKLMMINANLGVGLMPSFVTVDRDTEICMKTIGIPYRPRKFYILCRKDNPSYYVHEFVNGFVQSVRPE